MTRDRIRLLGTQDDAPLATFEAAQAEFNAEWAAAREAHIDLLSHVGGHWVQLLHRRKRPIKAAEISYVRREAQEIADKALALVAALAAAERVPGRYARGGEGGAS